MGQIIINKMSLSYPEGFTELTQAEISQMNTIDGPPNFAINDPERHMIVSGAFREASGFQAFMLNAKDVATHIEKQIAKAMKSYGYQRDKFMIREAAGNKGAGFSYTYKANEIDMCSESYIFEKDKVFYYLYFYYRKELIDVGRAAAEEILQSIAWL